MLRSTVAVLVLLLVITGANCSIEGNAKKKKISSDRLKMDRTNDKSPISDEDLKWAKASPYYKDGYLDIPVKDESIVELNQHWTDQAFAGLMAAVATNKFSHITKGEQKMHHECLKESENVQEHAKCVVELMSLVDRKRSVHLLRMFGVKDHSMSLASHSSKRQQRKSHLLFRDGFADPEISTSRTSAPNHELAFWKSQSKRVKSGVDPKQKNGKLELRSHRPLSKTGDDLILKEGENSNQKLAPKNLAKTQNRRRRVRAKREIVATSRDGYKLFADSDSSPPSMIYRHITHLIRSMKNKEGEESWQDVITEIKDKADKVQQRKRFEKAIKTKFDVMAKAARDAAMTDDEIEERENRERAVAKGRRTLAMPELDQLEQAIDDEDEREMMREARKQLDNMTVDDELRQAPVKIIREVIKLSVANKTKRAKDFDKKNLHVISPKFFSLTPEEEKSVNRSIDILSPSLLSLHGKGSELERKMSLENLMKSADAENHQDLMDLVVEATGVGDVVKDAMDHLEKTELMSSITSAKGPDGHPLYLNKENMTKIMGTESGKRADAFHDLSHSLNKQQMQALNKTGFTVMTPGQRGKFYGHDSPYRNAEVLKNTENMTDAQIRRIIRTTIREVAAGRLQYEARQNDAILSPVFGAVLYNNSALATQTRILSPVLFSAEILSGGVFGPVILSPYVFFAIMLSPRIISPVILNPILATPIMLNPLMMRPIILSPGALNPIILTPLVMCPFILSPQAMTPLILSPFVLNPFIFNPSILSPVVLSPFVLSPSVMSPGYHTAVILSPHALSPAIKSTGIGVTVFGSPSFLS